jgi:hypothetical protein
MAIRFGAHWIFFLSDMVQCIAIQRRKSDIINCLERININGIEDALLPPRMEANQPWNSDFQTQARRWMFRFTLTEYISMRRLADEDFK